MLASRALAEVLVLLAWSPKQRAQAQVDPYYEVCAHEDYENVGEAEEAKDGELLYRDIRKNQTHRFYYYNWDLEVMNFENPNRRLIINLEPCRGIVYLFVRKTRRCYPDPYSCVNIDPDNSWRRPDECKWTHFKSVIDGAMDGTPTFFEIAFATTRWYFSIFAVENSQYTFQVLAKTGFYPRPGNLGAVSGKQIGELEVEVQWDHAFYSPLGFTTTDQYWVYSAALLDTDKRSSIMAFMHPKKIMNTVCGLQNNTDQPYARITSAQFGPVTCPGGRCRTRIWGITPGRRYLFNVVAESKAGVYAAYAGVLMKTEWKVIREAEGCSLSKIIGGVAGACLGLIIIIYFMMLKLYA